MSRQRQRRRHFAAHCHGQYYFTGGTIQRVAVDVSGAPYIDLEREAQAMVARE